MIINTGFKLSTGIILFLLLFTTFSYSADTSRPGPLDKPTDVKLRIFILDVDEIIDAEQSFAANVFMQAEWKDPRLSKPGEITKYSLDDIWNPNFQIINRQKTFKSLPDIAQVDQDGNVIYRQRIFGKFSQPLDLRKFPMDQQTLNFEIISVGNTPSEVNLIQNSSGINEKFSLPNWKIINWEFEDHNFQFLPDVPAKEGVIFSITAERYIHFYVFKFIIPLLLIVFMSWIVFWIDPTDYASQISVAITSMLTLIAYQYLVGSSLPQVPYLTRLDELMFFSTAMVFFTLVEVVITSVLTKSNKVELARKFDYHCRYIFPAFFLFIIILPFI